MGYRRSIASYVSKKLVSDDFSIISDDCWGGEVYKAISGSPRTPTLGMGIVGDDYFTFLENLRKPDFTEFLPTRFYKNYPIAATPYAKIHFLHYPDQKTAIRIFQRKYSTINWDKVLYKIDLEKPYFTARHVEMWNDMKLPHSLALYSDRTRKIWKGPIHNGLYCRDYTLDGSAMFNISCRYFNVYHWVRTGEIKNNWMYRTANFLLLDPKSFKRLKNKFLKSPQVYSNTV